MSSTGSAPAPIKPLRRPGRPKKADTVHSAGDEESRRKERFRHAQRVYRSRKDEKFSTLTAKVAQLESALAESTSSFMKFHRDNIDAADISPRLALELSKAALTISEVSYLAKNGSPAKDREVRPDPPKELQAAIFDTPVSMIRTQNAADEMSFHQPVLDLTSRVMTRVDRDGHHQKRVIPATIYMGSATHEWWKAYIRGTFAYRLRRACCERGLRLLSKKNATYSDLNPTLSLHLTWFTVEQLRLRAEEVLSSSDTQKEYPHEDLMINITYPNMYRTVEGDSQTELRSFANHGQQLTYGRTRTKIDLGIPEFDGEFLECRDVEEYLDTIGIVLDGMGTSSVVKATCSKNTLDFIQGKSPSVTPVEEEEDFLDFSGCLPGSISSLTSTQHLEKRVNIIINVESLTEMLAHSAVCIGPGPGFRRDDVNTALRLSTLQI